jgi:flotillin
MIEEARGQVLAQVAQVRAEIERQKARALQVERQLQADVIQPYDADRQSLEESARGEAARIVEMGKAEATALKRLVEEYRRAGPHARDVLAMQQLMPLVDHIAGARRPTKVKKMTVLPGEGSEGSGEQSLARKAISAAEQIRAATGVDLADVAKRLGTPPTKAAAKPGDSSAPRKLPG